MKKLRADLHIHTVLSPCGDLEMSPNNIIQEAKNKGIHIIGITDHNSTKHTVLIETLAKKEGIHVLKGAEITTKEEVHCLCFFEKEKELNTFQEIIDHNLPDIKNDVDKFGYQVVLNEEEEIIEQEERLLISALNIGINQLSDIVYELNGIFIPAHIDKAQNSINTQLGFVDPNLKRSALGLSKHTTKKAFLEKNGYLSKDSFIQNSDAHYIGDLGCVSSIFTIKEFSFAEIKLALANKEGRSVEID